MSRLRAAWRRLGKWLGLALAAVWLAACATTRPAPPAPGDVVELHGMASWYGDEFAGRPTANGEVFDPKQFTAAHRTLPFGTVVEITYVKTARTTQVRVNDRGPFVGNRIIDLSYAAAASIGMIEDGIGEVELAVLSIGDGEREPPRPYNVTIPTATPAVPDVASTPPPAPQPAEPAIPAYGEPVIITEELDPPPPAAQPPGAPPPPATSVPPPPAFPPPAPPRAEPVPEAPLRSGWAVQLGAFSIESNAMELKAKLERVTGPVSIDISGKLYRVRVGPWAARSRAIEEKERLEAAGFNAIVGSVN